MKILYSNRGRIRVLDDDHEVSHRFEVLRYEIEGWIAGLATGSAAIGVAAGGATAAAAASVAGAELSSNAQKSAANSAATSQMNANQLNYKMYQQSRGSGGSAVFPTYLTTPNGSLFEPQLGSDLVGDYENSSVPLSSFQAAAGKVNPAETGANALTNNLFNGGVTKQMLDTQAPVNNQRLATAKSSSMDALEQTLNAIDSAQASRGYVGDSYANRLLKFQGNQAAGNAISAASLQNDQQNADITNYGNVTLPLQNISLPYTMAQTNAQESFLPEDQWLQSIGQRMQNLNMLKIGVTGPFQYQPLPTPGPGAYSGGANALSALGGAASGIGGAGLQYYLSKQNQQNLLNQIPNSQTDQILNEYNNGVDPSLYTSGAGLAGYNAAAGATSATGFDADSINLDSGFAGLN